MSRCVVIIPARYASSRFPGKPLVPIAGRPMIQHVYERACQARLVDEVLVATDDQRIVEAVQACGGKPCSPRRITLWYGPCGRGGGQPGV